MPGDWAGAIGWTSLQCPPTLRLLSVGLYNVYVGTIRSGSVVGQWAWPPHEEDIVSLSAPTQIVYIIAAILAIVGLIGALGYIAAISVFWATWLLFGGWLVLAVACLMKGL